jgi:hypothetical protein
MLVPKKRFVERDREENPHRSALVPAFLNVLPPKSVIAERRQHSRAQSIVTFRGWTRGTNRIEKCSGVVEV